MDQDKYIGRLLDNRYEIQEVLGVGGMAVVYKARCHRLNRLVAIKILKDEHAQDEEFRRRFHAESQAVAMLSHPNIVSVYDVASAGDANYIVMELIDGITLKQYMEKKGVLNWKETLHFAIQIGKALEHAHSRGIVHRDIKPHNVMVLKNGSVKVTDFGIARVMSKSNTLTKEALGSVHYISPEQAKGGRVDSRSDIYSLGVVMYEMITGRPPYDGESPVAVAIQHINGGARMPSVLNPNIPGGLEQIIMKAMAHDPGNRYNNATAMLYDMDEFRKDPTMLFYYNAAAAEDVTKLNKQPVPPVVKPVEPVRKTTAERVVSRTDGGYTGTPASRRVERPAKSTQSQSRPAPARRRREEDPEEDRSRVVTISIISCSVVAIVAIMIFLWTVLTGGWFTTPENKLLEVPNLLGQVYEDLDKSAYRGFEIVLMQREYSDEYAAGQIMSQEPAAGGDKVVEGTKIAVVVSMGEEPKAKYMDQDLVGTDLENAKSWLIGQGVPQNLILVREEYSELAAGKVTRTDPAYGEEIVEGQTVTIWSSLGKEVVTARMPNVVGMTFEEAEKKLKEEGFNDVSQEETESMEPAGTVVEQSETRYLQIDVTTPIVLKVSKGPETKAMLDVVGKTFEEAEKLLKAAGFIDVYGMPVESNEPEGTVVGQSVEEGDEIAVNDPITLEVSKGPKEVTMPDLVGKTFEEAETALKDLGFTVVNKNEVDDNAKAGEVVGQSVAKDEKITVDKEITLDVSKGPKEITMPDLAGKTFEEAEKALKDLGFTVINKNEVFDAADVGKVVSQSVAKDEKVTVDKEITLDVSKGPKVVAMPNVVNESFENARIKLDAWGFKNIVRKDVENAAAPGTVVSQSVNPDNQIPVTTEIVLEVSTGPNTPTFTKETVIFDLSKAQLTEKFDFAVGSLSEPSHRNQYEGDTVTVEITLEGYGIQHFDIYIDEIYVDSVRVVFSDDSTTTRYTVNLP